MEETVPQFTPWNSQWDKQQAVFLKRSLLVPICLCLAAVRELCSVSLSSEIQLYHYRRDSWPASDELLPTLPIKPHSRHICRASQDRGTTGSPISEDSIAHVVHLVDFTCWQPFYHNCFSVVSATKGESCISKHCQTFFYLKQLQTFDSEHWESFLLLSLRVCSLWLCSLWLCSLWLCSLWLCSLWLCSLWLCWVGSICWEKNWLRVSFNCHKQLQVKSEAELRSVNKTLKLLTTRVYLQYSAGAL